MLKRHFGKIFIPILLSGAFLLAGAAISQGAEYLQIPGLMDLRTTFSDGAYDVETLVGMARQKGFGIVILGDHDLMVMECGLPPLRNLLKKREERNSILRQGADGYLQAIRAAGKRYPDMVIVPGSLSSAFYYWTGHPITGDLTAHNHERRILNVGMERATDYEELPLLHNSHSIRYLMHGLPGIFLFSAAALTALAMIFWPGRWRAAAIIVLTLAVLFIINSDPFRNSPYDAYHPEALLETNGYTGFSALYGEKIRVTEPGGVWDTVLKDYCRGLRDRAVWGIATADFHREGESGEVLGNFQTVFLVREKNKIAVLEALRKGRIYATRGKYPQVARMDEFSVSSADGSVKGISGEDILLRGNPRIRIALSCEHAFPGPAKVRLIRGGEVIRTVEGPLPLVIEHEDKDNRHVGERTYYRMDVRGAGVIVSNPIFVSFSK
jgi:hypothetical protein